jgi:hypothetical protein
VGVAALADAGAAGTRVDNHIQVDHHDSIAKLVYERLKVRPMVLPVIVEV